MRTLLILTAMATLRAPGPMQEPSAVDPQIWTLETALESLPPIGREGAFDREKAAWTFEPPVLWLQSYLQGGGRLTDEQWRRALLRSGAIRLRERWPVDEPFAVSIETPVWLTRGTIEFSLNPPGFSIAARSGVSVNEQCGDYIDGCRRAARYQELGTLALGPQTLVFRVAVEREAKPRPHYAPRRIPGAPPPEDCVLPGDEAAVLWNGSMTFHVEGVATFEEALPGAHDEALGAAVRRALDAGLYQGVELVVRGDVDRVPELFDTALSLEIELRERDESRGIETRMILDRPGMIDQAMGWTLPVDLPDPSQWSLIVRGRPTLTLHAWNARRYWNGELVLSLADVQRH